MNIEIHKPELEALIHQQMQTGAFHDVEDVLLNALTIASASQARDIARSAHEFSAEQRLQNLRAWAQSHAGNTVVLADEDMERESIYGDRGV